jgi:hypothetical protein
MISGVSDSMSNSSLEKITRDNSISNISTPIIEAEVTNRNVIVKLEKEIDKIMNEESRENSIHRIEMEQNLLISKHDNDSDKDLDNVYELKGYYKYCTIM